MSFTMTLLQRIQLAPRVFELVFSKPEGLAFKPGQHIRFHCNGLERDYTPVSLDKDDAIRLCVSQGGTAGFSATLSTCDTGTDFQVSGPYGHFLYHPPGPSGPPAVFIGTGAGIAPFVAFARAGASDYILLQGARTPADLFYRDIVSQNSLTYVPCLSRPDRGRPDPFFNGRVTDYLEQVLPEGQYRFYLCGQRQMILDTMDAIDDRFPDSRVFTERFS